MENQFYKNRFDDKRKQKTSQSSNYDNQQVIQHLLRQLFPNAKG